MNNQKYINKSLIIYFKSSPYKEYFDYKAKDSNLLKNSVINSLFVPSFFKDVPSLVRPSTKDFEEGIWFEVRLVIHSHKDFSIGQVSFADDVASFAQEEFFPTPSKSVENKKYLPIVHITLDDSYIESLYSNKSLPKQISRSFQILDSSIWNKIVPFNKREISNIKVGGTEGLYKAIKEIESNYKRGLYNLEVAYEYANLNARLTKQAFLCGSHASGVSPFIFHSESAIEHLIEDEFLSKKNGQLLSQSTTERITDYKWRILLIDDKARTKLTPKIDRKGNERGDGLPWNCKLAIIKDNLESHFKNYLNFHITHNPSELKDENGILIEYAETLDKAKKAIETNKYDVILLDYLLNSDKGQIHYGYELLDAINVEYDNSQKVNRLCKYKLGPHGRLFYIFISAYSSAVYERLLAEGLNRSEKYWHIAVGACPTNTPQLFLYNLLKLMEKQLEDSGVDRLSPRGVFDIVNKIYGPAEGEDIGKPVRYRANKYYQKVLDLHYLYRKTLKDVEIPNDNIFYTKGSVLITNFITKNVNLGGLLEHLTQLVHLTAFGTIRQWPEMWEEYIYFKAQFDIQQFEADIKTQEGNARGLFNKLCENIESFILELKSDVE